LLLEARIVQKKVVGRKKVQNEKNSKKEAQKEA
jgi:hypothetical protein